MLGILCHTTEFAILSCAKCQSCRDDALHCACRRAPCVAEGEHFLQARRIILMAFGEGKAAAVAQTVEGPVTDQVGAWVNP